MIYKMIENLLAKQDSKRGDINILKCHSETTVDRISESSTSKEMASVMTTKLIESIERQLKEGPPREDSLHEHMQA